MVEERPTRRRNPTRRPRGRGAATQRIVGGRPWFAVVAALIGLGGCPPQRTEITTAWETTQFAARPAPAALPLLGVPLDPVQGAVSGGFAVVPQTGPAHEVWPLAYGQGALHLGAWTGAELYLGGRVGTLAGTARALPHPRLRDITVGGADFGGRVVIPVNGTVAVGFVGTLSMDFARVVQDVATTTTVRSEIQRNDGTIQREDTLSATAYTADRVLLFPAGQGGVELRLELGPFFGSLRGGATVGGALLPSHSGQTTCRFEGYFNDCPEPWGEVKTTSTITADALMTFGVGGPVVAVLGHVVVRTPADPAMASALAGGLTLQLRRKRPPDAPKSWAEWRAHRAAGGPWWAPTYAAEPEWEAPP